MTSKYNDSLNNETEISIISTFRRPKSKAAIDLGTAITTQSDEMYYNYNYNSLEENLNCNTLHHQGDDNVSTPSACPFSEERESEEEEKRKKVDGFLRDNGSTPISTVPGFVRLDPMALYDRICVQMNNYRSEGRYRRANLYVSLQESTADRFNVFLTGNATDSKTELYRGAKNSTRIKEIVDALFEQYPDIMIARLRYKTVRGFITDFHKKNTKSAVIGVYQNTEGDFVSVLILFDEVIVIPLTEPMTEKQKKIYLAHGVYNNYGEEDD